MHIFFFSSICSKLEAVVTQSACQKFPKCCRVFSRLGRWSLCNNFFARSYCETLRLQTHQHWHQWGEKLTHTQTHTLSGSHEKYKTLSMDGIALFKEKRRLKTRGDVRHHCHSSHDHRPPTTKHGYPRRPHTDTSSPETSSSASCT